jgi:hypothetical protein
MDPEPSMTSMDDGASAARATGAALSKGQAAITAAVTAVNRMGIWFLERRQPTPRLYQTARCDSETAMTYCTGNLR